MARAMATAVETSPRRQPMPWPHVVPRRHAVTTLKQDSALPAVARAVRAQGIAAPCVRHQYWGVTCCLFGEGKYGEGRPPAARANGKGPRPARLHEMVRIVADRIWALPAGSGPPPGSNPSSTMPVSTPAGRPVTDRPKPLWTVRREPAVPRG